MASVFGKRVFLLLRAVTWRNPTPHFQDLDARPVEVSWPVPAAMTEMRLVLGIWFGIGALLVPWVSFLVVLQEK